MSTPEAFEAELKQLAKDSRKVGSDGARGSAKHVRASVKAALHRTPYRRGLSHMGSGVKLGVGYRVKGNVALVSAKPAGPWQIAETGAKAHAIPKRGGNPHRVLTIGGDFVTGPIPHPGTRGYGPFEKGVEAGAPGIEKAYDVALDRSIRKVFG